MRGRTVGGHFVRDETEFAKTLGKEGRTVVKEVSGQDIGSTVRLVSGRGSQVVSLQAISGADTSSEMPGQSVRDKGRTLPSPFRGSVRPVLSASEPGHCWRSSLAWRLAYRQPVPAELAAAHDEARVVA